jgi:hypothetical protein
VNGFRPALPYLVLNDSCRLIVEEIKISGKHWRGEVAFIQLKSFPRFLTRKKCVGGKHSHKADAHSSTVAKWSAFSLAHLRLVHDLSARGGTPNRSSIRMAMSYQRDRADTGATSSHLPCHRTTPCCPRESIQYTARTTLWLISTK